MKNRIMLAIALCGSFLSSSASFAAPMPATATSKLVAPQLGVFRSPIGFEISGGKSGWAHAQAPANNKFIATLYRGPKGSKSENASLTVRVDKLTHDVALDKYIQKWMKEYPKYGFDVLNSRAFSENKNKGYFLDLLNKDSGKQLRQVVYLNKKRAVILTCRDKKETFQESLKNCNEIVRTFAWTE